MKKKDINQFNFRGSFNNPTSIEIEGMLLPMSIIAFNNFCNNNKQVLDTYTFWKEKIEELKYRIDFTYKLSVVKNRDSDKSIIARVKWQYKYKEEYRKPAYIGVYIGSLKDFPKGLEEHNLNMIAKSKIEEYFAKKIPIILQDIDGNEYQL